MRYNVILFDADDTLYDYAQSEAFALAGVFGEIHQECTNAIVDSYRRINQQLWNDFEQGIVTQGELRTARFERLLEEHSIKCALDAEAFSNIYIKYFRTGLLSHGRGREAVQSTVRARSTHGHHHERNQGSAV